jgi:putative tryptophan/tyrosine transport system substrate-binding protein
LHRLIAPALLGAFLYSITSSAVASRVGGTAGLGLVHSLARPGGNLTGVNFFAGELAAKRLEVLRMMVPRIARVAVLVDPASTSETESTVRDVQSAAHTIGLQIQIFTANTNREIDKAFATFVRERHDSLMTGPSPFFTARRSN